MASIYTIQSRLLSLVNDGLKAQWLHSFLREHCYKTIDDMISKRTPQYEVHGLRSFANGMLDLEYHRSYQRNCFYVCKDNNWRCKGYYTYGNQPELLTCVHDLSILIFPYAYNIGDEIIRVYSINSSELEKIDEIEKATGIPIAKIEYGLVGDIQKPMRVTLKPDFNNPIIEQVSKKDLVAGIKLN